MAAKKENKLEMVPVAGQTKFAAESSALQSTAGLAGALMETEEMPDASKLERLNLPPMLDLKLITVGSMVSGEVVKLVENFTGREDMRKARLIHLRHKSGIEFLIPMSGVIKNALKTFVIQDKNNKDDYTLDPKLTGRTLYIKRLPDGASKKYGGKPMFMFDVLISKA